MSRLKAGDLIADVTQVYDLFDVVGTATEPGMEQWIVLLCSEGPRGQKIMMVDNAPVEGLDNVVATLRQATAEVGAAFTGAYITHNRHGVITFPEWIQLEEGS
jgi:hypothetical protein